QHIRCHRWRRRVDSADGRSDGWTDFVAILRVLLVCAEVRQVPVAAQGGGESTAVADAIVLARVALGRRRSHQQDLWQPRSSPPPRLLLPLLLLLLLFFHFELQR